MVKYTILEDIPEIGEFNTSSSVNYSFVTKIGNTLRLEWFIAILTTDLDLHLILIQSSII